MSQLRRQNRPLEPKLDRTHGSLQRFSNYSNLPPKLVPFCFCPIFGHSIENSDSSPRPFDSIRVVDIQPTFFFLVQMFLPLPVSPIFSRESSCPPNNDSTYRLSFFRKQPERCLFRFQPIDVCAPRLPHKILLLMNTTFLLAPLIPPFSTSSSPKNLLTIINSTVH